MKLLSALLATLFLVHVQALAAPYMISADGHEVTDQATGLTWRRCSEGMGWDGSTCAGTVLTFSRENALTRSKTEAAASDKVWRLPNVKELGSLVDRSRGLPAIKVAIFPATPSIWFWSSSTYVNNSKLAWVVNFGGGYNGGTDADCAVRLVRASQ
ncbi:MAG: DUF1566 domain-containing protein [Pseudomonadota bacterium]|nr:DUF1566 domain-containing protein [Pseudomonadota bacterium]MDP1903818.1 DUF1566 domain-containing protein [Pseudomonadota bacterium]MDP2353484.1 DUF1566 domain-containing protein [Pseudomonadota bacterium]